MIFAGFLRFFEQNFDLSLHLSTLGFYMDACPCVSPAKNFGRRELSSLKHWLHALAAFQKLKRNFSLFDSHLDYVGRFSSVLIQHPEGKKYSL